MMVVKGRNYFRVPLVTNDILLGFFTGLIMIYMYTLVIVLFTQFYCSIIFVKLIV